MIEMPWLDSTEPRSPDREGVLVMGEGWVGQVEIAPWEPCGRTLPANQRIGVCQTAGDAICMAMPGHEHPHIAINKYSTGGHHRIVSVSHRKPQVNA